MYCVGCGHHIADNAQACEQCGLPLVSSSRTEVPQLLAEPSQRLIKSLRTCMIIASVLYVADTFFFLLPFDALVLFGVVLLYFLPATLWALRTDRRVARLRAAKAGIFLFAAVSIVATIGLQNRMAARRAEKLGDACLAYRAKYHHYPRALKALVPEFIPSVPVAKYGIGFDTRFEYLVGDEQEEPMLYYTAVPPFGRIFYHMESRTWGYMD